MPRCGVDRVRVWAWAHLVAATIPRITALLCSSPVPFPVQYAEFTCAIPAGEGTCVAPCYGSGTPYEATCSGSTGQWTTLVGGPCNPACKGEPSFPAGCGGSFGSGYDVGATRGCNCVTSGTITATCIGTGSPKWYLEPAFCPPPTCGTFPPDPATGGDWTKLADGAPCIGVSDGETCSAPCIGGTGTKQLTCRCSGTTCSYQDPVDTCAASPTCAAEGPDPIADCGPFLPNNFNYLGAIRSCSCLFGGSGIVSQCELKDGVASWVNAGSTTACPPQGSGPNANCPNTVSGLLNCEFPGGGIIPVGSTRVCPCKYGTGPGTDPALTLRCDLVNDKPAWVSIGNRRSCPSEPVCLAAGPDPIPDCGDFTGQGQARTCTCKYSSNAYGNPPVITARCGYAAGDVPAWIVISEVTTCPPPPAATTCNTAPVDGPWTKSQVGGACTGVANGGTCTAPCPSGTGSRTVTCSCTTAGCSFGEAVDSCEAAPTCPANAPTVAHGSFPAPGDRSVGAKLTAACDANYEGAPTPVATCKQTGTTADWDVTGNCTAKPPEPPKCPAAAPPVAYGRFPAPSDRSVGAKLTAACDADYEGTPTPVATCKEKGTTADWEVSGACTAKPQEAPKCPAAAPSVAHGSFPAPSDRSAGAKLTAACDADYEGTPTPVATCKQSGTTADWEISGACTAKPQEPAKCVDQPTVQYGVFPSPASRALGASVTGSCNYGYEGTPVATCKQVGGLTSFVVDGQCTPKPQCPTKCYYSPPGVDGISWPNTCYGARQVKAYCGPDYEDGYVEATCECGVWVVTGTCKLAEKPRCDDYCHSMPPNLAGISWPNSCYGRKYYKAACRDGYYPGSVEAKCECGEWVIYGTCKKIEQPRCDKYCFGLPPAADGVYWPGHCWGSSYFKAYCIAGYNAGYVEAFCKCGQWYTKGACNKVEVPLNPELNQTCWGKPARKKYGRSWSWKKCHGKHSCTTKCSAGCTGKGYTATCKAGKWAITGSCTCKKFLLFGKSSEHP